MTNTIPTSPVDGADELLARFNALYLEHAAYMAGCVHQFCHQRVPYDRGLAEEAINDGWMKVYRALPTTLDAHRGWVYTVLMNAARDRVRLALHRRPLHFQPLDRLAPADVGSLPYEEDPADVVERWEDLQAVGVRLNALSARERQVLALRVEGVPYVQIAERLGASARTVRTWVWRARGKLTAPAEEGAARRTDGRSLLRARDEDTAKDKSA